jgi:hypothetical protein
VKQFAIIILLLGATTALRAQDSLAHHTALDSIQSKFNNQSDSIQKKFAAPLNKIDNRINKLHHQKDSLTHLNLPTKDVTHQLDSLNQLQSAKTQEINASIQNLKKKTLGKVSDLHLPPQAKSEIAKLTKSISSYSVPTDFFKGMDLNIASLLVPSLSLPSSFSIPSMSIPSLQKLDIKNIAQLPSLEKYKNELSQATQLKSKANAKELEKLALKEATQIGGMKELQGQEGKLSEVKSELDKAKDANPQQAAQMAVNHFAGKEQQLKAAMEQVSKYKQKYSSIKSLADIPKRPPNPLKGKHWYERTIVGMNYFIMNKSYTMVDFNPYVGWKFTPHLSATIGWNERIGISHWNFHTNTYDRVWGIRTAVNYSWTHGIVFKIAPEVMDAYVPTTRNLDQKHEVSVLGFYAGIRKDFPIYKKIKGYSEVLYNFTQSSGRNIYGDPVSFRIGIETSLQRKVKKGQSNVISPKSILDSYSKKFKAIKSPKDSFDIICKDKLYGVVTINGDTLVKPLFTSIQKFMKKTSPYFIVSKENKFGAIDNKGRMVIKLEKDKSNQIKRELVRREIEHLNFDNVSRDANYFKPK